jgi:hypothetical protein
MPAPALIVTHGLWTLCTFAVDAALWLSRPARATIGTLFDNDGDNADGDIRANGRVARLIRA